MPRFDEQIKKRKLNDEKLFENAFADMADAVLDRRMAKNLREDEINSRDAIEAILHYYHVKVSETAEIPDDPNEQLDILLRPSGIMRRNVRLEAGWYHDAIGPMIAARKDNGQIVALLPSGFEGYCFTDRESGKKISLNRRSAGLLQDEAIAFYKPFPQKKLNWPDLIGYMFGLLPRSDMAALILMLVLITLSGLLVPAVNNILFGQVITLHSHQLLVAAGVFLVCLTVSSTIFNTIRDLVMARLCTRLRLNVEAATMMRVLSMPASFFNRYSAGELSSYISNLNSICMTLCTIILSAGFTALFSLSYIGQIVHYAPKLVFVTVCILLADVLVDILFTFLQVKISREKMVAQAKEAGLGLSLFNGIRKIRLSGAEKRAFAKWAEVYSKSARLQYNPPAFLKLNPVIQLMITSAGTIWIYYTAVKASMTSADYIAFNAAYGMVAGAFSLLCGMVNQAAQIRPALDTVRPLLDTVPEYSEEKITVTDLQGDIELNHVTFRYSENMPAVLDDLSLKIHPGQYVAIVGKTGCGKSTLIRLLLGFEKAQKGSVYFDGRDIGNLDLRSLRKKIGVVTQNGKLFQGDIFSNITVSAPYLTIDDAWEAARTAGIADDIEKMPMGMSTMISEGGGGISGGQKQRLMIARAIAPKPKVLIFDEATSALDNITQKKVSDALDRLNCTRLVIAHRLSTIRQCDRILVLDGGHIIEDGTYEELAAAGGFFSELVKRQQIH